ncbi:hypothetical protein MPER_14994 [Moniliophthora perniciosa FA553]|nr:hypothetical protein MPER_14994 [Moniliophthora perniciosa FA553]
MGNIRPADGSIYLNPEGIPSHPMALQLHGIQDAELVAPLPTFSAHAEQLRSFLAGSIMTGYNITKFDLAFLTAEFHRCGITWSPAGEGIGTIDTLALYRRFRPQEYKRGGKLFSAYLHFVGGWQTQAHNAEADAFTALRLLYAMVEDPDIQTSVAMSLQGLYYPSRTDETSR